MPKRFVLLVPFLVALPALAGAPEFAVTNLKGIRLVHVAIEKVTPAASQVGLTEDALQTFVEVRLRRMGIQVAPNTKWDVPAPVIYVRISAVGGQSTFSYDVFLGVQEVVTVERTRRRTIGFVWDGGSIGHCSPNSAVEVVEKAVGHTLESFENDWREANSGVAAR